LAPEIENGDVVARSQAPFHYFGGKGMLLKQLLNLIPEGRVYVEPFGGAASVLFAKKPSPIEVYNDLNGMIVNLFRCLQDPERFKELKHRLTYTLFSRSEFKRAIDILKSGEGGAEMQAWAFFTAQNQIISGVPEYTPGRWSRTREIRRGMAANCSKWDSQKHLLEWWHKRLSRVQIEQRDALAVLKDWDRDDVVFYLDPPYVHSTRKSGRYVHEMADEEHVKLIEEVIGLEGAVILSTYDNDIYSCLETKGWAREAYSISINARVIKTKDYGTGKRHGARTEIIWRNPRALRMCGQGHLF
jgi:DNA adenine methylase